MLKSEITLFLTENNSEYVKLFQNEIRLCKLCYLSDLFEKLNELNISLQGENTNTFLLKNKIQAFIIKLAMWLQKGANDSFEMFSYTQDFIVEKSLMLISLSQS